MIDGDINKVNQGHETTRGHMDTKMLIDLFVR